MKVLGRAVAIFLVGASTAAGVSAQTVGIATTPAGSFTNSTGTAIAKVIVEHTGIQARIQPQASHAHMAIEQGEIELGINNYYDILFFVQGTEDYAGTGVKKNTRAIANILPLLVGVMVRTDSDIKQLADLKGKRLAAGFGAQKGVERAVRAYLANAGLTYNDVVQVPAQNVVMAADDFKAGKTDAFLFALGAAKVKEVAASVGGVRALPAVTGEQAIKAADKLIPGTYAYTVKPNPAMEEVKQPTPILAYDLIMFGNAKVRDDTIYKIVKAIHNNKKGMVSIFPPLRMFEPAEMAKPFPGLDYHPGAVKYYREAGIWPGK